MSQKHCRKFQSRDQGARTLQTTDRRTCDSEREFTLAKTNHFCMDTLQANCSKRLQATATTSATTTTTTILLLLLQVQHSNNHSNSYNKQQLLLLLLIPLIQCYHSLLPLLLLVVVMVAVVVVVVVCSCLSLSLLLLLDFLYYYNYNYIQYCTWAKNCTNLFLIFLVKP